METHVFVLSIMCWAKRSHSLNPYAELNWIPSAPPQHTGGTSSAPYQLCCLGKASGALVSPGLVWGRWSRTGAADSRLDQAQAADITEHREPERFHTQNSSWSLLCWKHKPGLCRHLFFMWSQKSRWLKVSNFKLWQRTKHLRKHCAARSCVCGSIREKSATRPSPTHIQFIYTRRCRQKSGIQAVIRHNTDPEIVPRTFVEIPFQFK